MKIKVVKLRWMNPPHDLAENASNSSSAVMKRELMDFSVQPKSPF